MTEKTKEEMIAEMRETIAMFKMELSTAPESKRRYLNFEIEKNKRLLAIMEAGQI